MSDAISKRFDLMVPHGKLEPCIAQLEDALKSIKKTPYHCVIGKSFLPQLKHVADYMNDFYERASKEINVSAIYYEMNGFEINPKQWHFDGFAFTTVGDVWNLGWLADWNAETNHNFILRGMEPVQKAFAANFLKKKTLTIDIAESLAEHLVAARFMQLIAAADKIIKSKKPKMRGLQVLATAHDWDTVHLTK